MTPPPEITENIFAMDADARAAKGIEALPGTLIDAIQEMKKDRLILDTLGEHIASNYIEGKQKEWDAYRTRVSSWELDRYLINY